MEVSLNRVDKLFWTIDSLEHVQKYKDSFDFIFTNEEIEKERNNILKGTPSIRISSEIKADIYIIHINNDIGGEIIVSVYEDNLYELTINVFDKHSHRGVAFTSLKKFLQLFVPSKYNFVIGKVRQSNVHKERVRNLLKSCGFYYDNLKQYWIYPKNLVDDVTK